ncbi:MAG TPA: trypsin-like peptidase domain-containing protein [Candidatus Angelobacter sp.]|nr:trypsin-like peptidase domain-containing protein [Candidatus Angelobacter sp.]
MNTSIINQWKSTMKRRLIVPVLALAIAAGFGSYELFKPAGAIAATAAPAAAPLDDNTVSALLSLDRAMETLAAHVTPAVVNVTVTARAKAVPLEGQDQDQLQQFFGPFGNPFGQRMQREPQIEHGLGSGIVISSDGYIVTNNHVVKDATDIRVTLNDRRVLPAKLVGADPMTDLAVIKVNASNMSSLPWGDSTALHPGQTVLAFGNPFGFRFTVTRGIVSALNRANPYSDDPRKPGQFIQTDAAINPGNSGGALVDARGQVVGINTFLISASGSFSGMGFAIPAEIARPTVQTLIKYGKVDHAYIGVGIADVTPENAKFFHMDQTIGAVISQVEPDSPGAKAGLKVGDVITGVNGHEVSDAGHLQVIIGQERPGSKVNLDVMRDGKTMTVPVTVDVLHGRNGDSSGSSSAEHGKARWGIGLDNMTPELREQLQLPSEVHGAVITNVQPGSPADNAGLTRGEVIVEVNRHKVESSADVKRELGNIAPGQDALVLVWSNGGSTFRVLRPTTEE